MWLITGCHVFEGSPEPSSNQAAKDVRPALIKVSESRTDLLYRYRTKDGFQTATSIGEIPDEARGRVQVIDLSKTPDERRSAVWVQVFDLSGTGGFKGRLVARTDLESALRKAHEAKPRQPSVVMYSASWCGVCTKARRFMKKNGIVFVEKDIEKDRGASRELARKAKAAGVNANGVPVFDVGGRIFSGFDPTTLMKHAGRGTGRGR